MKQVCGWLSLGVLIFGLSALNPLYATKKKGMAPREPGKWAFAFQGFGNIPTNSRARKHYKSGLGVGWRLGYGFGPGLSVDLEMQYDLLFKERGTNKIEENKSLVSLAPGIRYTADFLPDMSGYLFLLFGATFDYTESVVSDVNLSYATGLGMEFELTENLSIGPQIKYRHVMSDEDRERDNRMSIHFVGIGVAMTYVYD